jgi:Methane oxygenase PmoA
MIGSMPFPRVQVVPGVGRASMRLDGVERVGYEFGEGMSRPFFFPVVGRSGGWLTRLGHPDPIGHEHHRSIWFGHRNVAGINFWEERPNTDIRIYHRRVRLYHDGHDRGGFVAELDWWAQGRSILHQELTAVIEPAPFGGFALDLESRFDSADGAPVLLGQTNFGFLGVRVAKTISEQFGGGRLTNSEGLRGERALLGTAGRWVDYSGPSAPGAVEGICVMDHPSNYNHPTHWHVQSDGLVGPSFNRESAHGVARDHSLLLQYRLLVHSGTADLAVLNREWDAFARTDPYTIVAGDGDGLETLRHGEAPGGYL